MSETDPRMVYRLWLRNHIDPRDPARLPYVAKHRGTPLDMPDFLEDAPGSEPWSDCSLAVFFRRLQTQLDKLDVLTKAKYPNASGMWRGDTLTADAEEIIGGVVAPMQVPVVPTAQIGAVGGALPTAVTSTVAPATQPGVAGGRRRRVASSAVVTLPVTSTSPTGAGNPVTPPVVAAGAAVAEPPAGQTPEPPSIIAQQLQASLDLAHQTGGVFTLAGTVTPAPTLPNPTATAPPAVQATSAPVPTPTPTAPPIAPTSTRFRRAARPPVQ